MLFFGNFGKNFVFLCFLSFFDTVSFKGPCSGIWKVPQRKYLRGRGRRPICGFRQIAGIFLGNPFRVFDFLVPGGNTRLGGGWPLPPGSQRSLSMLCSLSHRSATFGESIPLPSRQTYVPKVFKVDPAGSYMGWSGTACGQKETEGESAHWGPWVPSSSVRGVHFL